MGKINKIMMLGNRQLNLVISLSKKHIVGSTYAFVVYSLWLVESLHINFPLLDKSVIFEHYRAIGAIKTASADMKLRNVLQPPT